jgi:hypothetical protein
MAEVRMPGEADLARLIDDPVALMGRPLAVIEEEIVPLTRAGVTEGNKVFGGAVLRKSDLSTVVSSGASRTASTITRTATGARGTSASSSIGAPTTHSSHRPIDWPGRTHNSAPPYRQTKGGDGEIPLP